MSKDLNELRELILLVEKDSNAKSVILGNGGGAKNTKLGKLFDGITDGLFNNDEDAATQGLPENCQSGQKKCQSE